jgi:hypothetical protein
MKIEEPNSEEMKLSIASKPGVPMSVCWPGWQQKTMGAPVKVQVFTPAEEEPRTRRYRDMNGFTVHMALPDPTAEPWPIVPRWVPVTAHSGSEDALRAARRFIKKCKREHGSQCCSGGKGGLLPTRLLDVRGFADGRCRLRASRSARPDQDARDSPQEHKSVPYVALSYCWGGEQPHKTVSSNVEERTLEGFDVSMLSLTLREAVEFTFRLGIRYLWVDSLCIIQDDPLDWSQEASRMGGIYESAMLTLAADHASTASSGLFCRHSLGDSVGLTIPGPGGKSFSICARRGESTCSMMISHDDSDTTNPHVKASPLARRGWTLQERMLSSRILYFTDRELVWECKGAFLCECQGPQGKERRSLVSINVLEDLASQRRDFDDTWATIVRNFSRRKLTRESDKLPALTGLINRMDAIYQSVFGPPSSHHKRGRRCLSGLWERDMAGQLCWYSDPGSRATIQRSSETVFPSWSWASVNGPLFMQGKVESRIEVVSHRSRSHGVVQDIAMDTEELTLRGLVVPIQIRHRPAGPYQTLDMISLETRIYDEPAGYFIRPSRLAARADEETARITAIPDEARTVKDKLLLRYIENGEQNHRLDYTSTKAQPSSWQDRGYIALLVGEHVGGAHGLDGKYQWGVRYSHWMILAPVPSSEEPVPPPPAKQTPAASRTCKPTLTGSGSNGDDETVADKSHVLADAACMKEEYEVNSIVGRRRSGSAKTETDSMLYERVAMMMKIGLFECRLRPEGVEREVVMV